MSDVAVVICLKVAEAKFVVPGSTMRQCRECKEDVWMSQSSAAMEADQEVHPMCMECFLVKQVTDNDPEPVEWQPVPGALDEVRNALAPNDVSKVEALMKRWGVHPDGN